MYTTSRTRHQLPSSTLLQLSLAIAIAVVASVASVALKHPPIALAQSPLQLTVSPPVSYLHVKPGMRATHTITIHNTGDSQVTVTPAVNDFSVDPETGLPILADELSFEHFVSLAQQLQPIKLEPDQRAQLTLAIAPPQTASEKEYPISVVFRASQPETQQASKVTGSVASNLIMLVSPRNSLPKSLELADLGAPKFIDSFQPLELRPKIKNSGLSAATASGSAVIRNWYGTQVAAFELYPDNVLGFSSRPARALDTNKPDSTQPLPLRYAPQLLLGPYTITYVLDNDGTLETYQHTTIAVPSLVLLALAAGTGVAVWYWKSGKTRNPLE